MNPYEAKQQARRDRLEKARDSLRAASDRTLADANKRAEVIPFGQPILVGHHSEARDRRYRAGIAQQFGRGFDLAKRADALDRRAEAVGSGGISSDDPAAVDKLRAQLATAQATQDRMKKANALIRKKDRPGLAALGFSAEDIDGLFKPDFAGRIGYPAYALQNNSANIRRIEARIKDLQARAEAVDVDQDWTFARYREDVAANRIYLVFDHKPDADTRALLKSYAFRWTPSANAWGRFLNPASRYAALALRDAMQRRAEASAAPC